MSPWKRFSSWFRYRNLQPPKKNWCLITYPNGAEEIIVDGKLLSCTYNTDDIVWFDKKGQVLAYWTHDGRTWSNNWLTAMDLLQETGF